ncbi:MAG: hypothetical protein KY466_02925 [Gemmatimonadetes bacterium]|nr:hypothetical protein [Gemmatimonadota bacterium]
MEGHASPSGESRWSARDADPRRPRQASRIPGLRRVLSHPIALAQCQRFLADHPSIEAVAVYDTAAAAKDVAAAGDPGTAAIASRTAAERYLQNSIDHGGRGSVRTGMRPSRAILKAFEAAADVPFSACAALAARRTLEATLPEVCPHGPRFRRLMAARVRASRPRARADSRRARRISRARG